MTLWFGLALMTAAAIWAVLWPLARRASQSRSGSDVAIYRDQLEEIERDRNWLARRASGHNTAHMAAAVMSASPNHSVIYQSVGLNLHCLGDAAKTELSRIGARPARLHHGERSPCNGERPSKPRHGEAGLVNLP